MLGDVDPPRDPHLAPGVRVLEERSQRGSARRLAG
jgi:hypothetical protein